MEDKLVLLVLLVSVISSLLYYLFLFIAYCKVRITEANPDKVPVSIIIAAKDEADNLKNNLPVVLNQHYEEFEVIVVDDNSSDHTVAVLQQLTLSHKNLRYVSLKGESGKKRALAQGIELAKSDWLLFTDADCAPASDKWILSMVAQISSGTQLVLGYSPFIRTGGLVNLFARIDAFTIGVQYLAFAIFGKTYMGVGRNIAYRKSLFHSQGGFDKHKHILSGDDDLFVQGAASSGNTAVMLAPDSQTKSNSKTSFFTWFIQKRRHTSTGFHYKFSTLVLLGLIQLITLLFYAAMIRNLIQGVCVWETVVLALIRFCTQYFVLKKSALKLGEMDLLLLSSILELPLIIFNLFAAIPNILFMNKRWS